MSTRKNDLKQFLSLIEPEVASVASDEEQAEIEKLTADILSRKAKLDPKQSTISEFFTPIGSTKSPTKSLFATENLKFNIGTADKSSGGKKSKVVMGLKGKQDILSLLGIEEDTRHSDLLIPSTGVISGDPEELRATMDGQTRRFHSVKALDLLQEEMKPRPLTLILATVISYFKTRNERRSSEFGRSSALNFKLSTSSKILKPDLNVHPPVLPIESWNIFRHKQWEAAMGKFMNKWCFSAKSIWTSGDREFPVSPEPNEFAVYIERSMDDFEELTEEVISGYEFKWAMENLHRSSENQSHANVLTWIDSVIREASAKVPILLNAIDTVENMDLQGLNQARINHYKELDDYMKMLPGRAFGMEELRPNQTYRQFRARIQNIVSNLAKIGAAPRPELQKHVLIEAFCMMYGYKFLPRIQNLVYDKRFALPETAMVIEEVIKEEGLDPKFNKTLTKAQIEELRAQRVDPKEDLDQYAVPINEDPGKNTSEDPNVALQANAIKGSNGKKNNKRKSGESKTDQKPSDSRKRKADGLDGGNDAAEHLRRKAYEAFASDPEITDRQLNATADLVETVANFSLTGAKEAQKKFMRKIKKQIKGIFWK